MEDMARKTDAHDVAGWFINRIDRSMGQITTTDMIQRMLYFAQAWYLANTGHELFEEEFEAWGTGPVVPAVYERFKNLDAASLPDIENSRTVKGSKLEMLELIQQDYGCYQPFKLDELAKEPGGPWDVARRGTQPLAPSNTIIAKDAMKKFYRAKISNAA